MNVFEITGWIGFVLYLVAYFLLAAGIIFAGKLYYCLNIIAALFIVVVSLFKETYQAVVVNILWGVISCLGLYRHQIKGFTGIIKPFRISMFMLLVVSICCIIFDHYLLGVSILAWTYVSAFVFSYYLFVNRGFSIIEFHSWNLFAALIIIPKLVVDENWPVFALELFWAFSAALGIGKHVRLAYKDQPKG